MEIKVINDRIIRFKEFSEEKIWESEREITNENGYSTLKYYLIGFKSKIVSINWDIEDYNFESYLVRAINYILKNEALILIKAIEVINSILKANNSNLEKQNVFHCGIDYVSILNVVSNEFKVHITTSDPYVYFVVKFSTSGYKWLSIESIKYKILY